MRRLGRVSKHLEIIYVSCELERQQLVFITETVPVEEARRVSPCSRLIS